VAHTSLRILGSKFLLDHWCDISLDEQLQQLFLLLSTTCIIVSYDDEFEQDDSETNEEADSAYLMSTSKLAFLIPLLEELLVRNPKSFDMELRIRAVLFLKSAIAPNFIRVLIFF
jgi:hypothetical protein